MYSVTLEFISSISEKSVFLFDDVMLMFRILCKLYYSTLLATVLALEYYKGITLYVNNHIVLYYSHKLHVC